MCDCFSYHSRATASKLFAAFPAASRFAALRWALGSMLSPIGGMEPGMIGVLEPVFEG
jgi:hypothetical protein